MCFFFVFFLSEMATTTECAKNELGHCERRYFIMLLPYYDPVNKSFLWRDVLLNVHSSTALSSFIKILFVHSLNMYVFLCTCLVLAYIQGFRPLAH